MATQSHSSSGFELGNEFTWILFKCLLVTTKHKRCTVHLNIEFKPWLRTVQALKLWGTNLTQKEARMFCSLGAPGGPRLSVILGDASKNSHRQKGRTPTSAGSKSAKLSRHEGVLAHLWMLQGHGTEQAAVGCQGCLSLAEFCPAWCCPRQPGEAGEHHPVWIGAPQDMPPVARPLN